MARMGKKLSSTARIVIVNAAIFAGLLWSYYSGKPVTAIAIVAVVLLPLANLLLFRRNRSIGR